MTERDEIRKCLCCKRPECTNCMATGQGKKWHRWTPEDMKLIADESLSITKVARILGVSYGAVQIKRYEWRKQNGCG